MSGFSMQAMVVCQVPTKRAATYICSPERTLINGLLEQAVATVDAQGTSRLLESKIATSLSSLE